LWISLTTAKLRNDDSRRFCALFVSCTLLAIVPRDGEQILSEVCVPVLSIVCEPCGLRERYDVERLMRQYGWDATVCEKFLFGPDDEILNRQECPKSCFELSPPPLAMTAICAFRPAGVDVNRPLRIAAVDVAVGRHSSASVNGL
jgi:hypothetical protein